MANVIELTDKQIEILSTIAAEKQLLQKEFEKLVKRESDVIVTLAEAKGIVVTPSNIIKLEGNKLVIEDGEDSKVKKKKA